MNYHGISLQAPVVCSVVTLSSAVGAGRDVRYQGITIEFSKIAPTLFSGFMLVDDFAIATPEKAVLGTLHLRKALPAADELDWDAVDRNAMCNMARLFPLSVTRRLEAALGRE